MGSYDDGGVVCCRRILVEMRRGCCAWADHKGKNERGRKGWWVGRWLCATVWL